MELNLETAILPSITVLFSSPNYRFNSETFSVAEALDVVVVEIRLPPHRFIYLQASFPAGELCEKD